MAHPEILRHPCGLDQGLSILAHSLRASPREPEQLRSDHQANLNWDPDGTQVCSPWREASTPLTALHTASRSTQLPPAACSPLNALHPPGPNRLWSPAPPWGPSFSVLRQPRVGAAVVITTSLTGLWPGAASSSLLWGPPPHSVPWSPGPGTEQGQVKTATWLWPPGLAAAPGQFHARCLSLAPATAAARGSALDTGRSLIAATWLSDGAPATALL